MLPLSRRRTVAVAVLSAVLPLAACSQASTAAPTADAATVSPSPDRTSPEAAEAAGGLEAGEIPPIPLIVIPDLSMLDSSLAGFAIDLDRTIGDVPGVTVVPTHCDASGTPEVGVGALLSYGDGSGTFTAADGSVVNYGDGSGTYTINGTTVTVYGDGSGTYEADGTSVVSYGDGSGSYDDGTTSVILYGDGSGTWTRGSRTITNYGDGSGSYEDGTVSITNYGDGSGSYEDGTISITNYGDGGGTIDGEPVDLSPITPVTVLGSFPSMGTIAPVESCGATLTLDAGVLFDFGSAELRDDAQSTLDSLADALAGAGVPEGSVEGHTDSVSSADFNQQLSEDRAQAVADALVARGVTTSFDVVGWGEDRPVAPNELAGQDNPAGRELNRRVEIVLPDGS
ncbi:OmpA family protein [Cellulomonas soli]|uniref:OmpA-like domain-containing protein n=1 Tax=Cellulomonas soli TaxID=931535 RepID=A0A512PEE7_9CELL|nr:OmpA family protein [Cellulomonas soli]GEP69556.1 hypothetical protein CSO01_22710 [Cellulomonas soli]